MLSSYKRFTRMVDAAVHLCGGSVTLVYRCFWIVSRILRMLWAGYGRSIYAASALVLAMVEVIL